MNKRVGHRARGSSAIADVPDGSVSMQSKGANLATLSFEMRNFGNIEPFTIRLNDNLVWEATDAPTHEYKDNTSKVIQMVRDNKEISNSELLKKMKQITGLADRTIQNRIKDAIETGKITKTKKGNNTLYNLGE